MKWNKFKADNAFIHIVSILLNKKLGIILSCFADNEDPLRDLAFCMLFVGNWIVGDILFSLNNIHFNDSRLS